MERVEITALYANTAEYGDKEITICGWVRTIRDSKALGFMELNDGSCFKGIQVVFEAEKLINFAEVAKLNVGAAVTVQGEFVITPQAKQPFEVHACKVSVEGTSSPEYPLQKKRHSMNIFGLLHICVRVQIRSAQHFVYVRLRLMQFTNFFRREALCTPTRLFLQEVTVRARGRCLQSQPWTLQMHLRPRTAK